MKEPFLLPIDHAARARRNKRLNAIALACVAGALAYVVIELMKKGVL